MAISPDSGGTRAGIAAWLRYGLAVTSVGAAVGITIVLRSLNSPPRFLSHFILIAIAITFWYAGTGPGLLSLLLSCAATIAMAKSNLVLAAFPLIPFLIFYGVFSLLLGWFSALRRRAEQRLIEARDMLEIRVVERTADLVRVNHALQNTQDELRRREEHLAEAQKLSHTGSFGWNLSTGEVFWSDEMFHVLEYDQTTKPASELLLERVHPDDVALMKQAIENTFHDGEAFDLECRLIMPDASIKYVHLAAHAIKDQSGDGEVVGALMDVTSAHQAEMLLRRSEHELSLMIETIPGLVWCASPQGEVTYLNQRIVDFLGTPLSDLPPGGCAEFVHPDDREARQKAWAQAVATGQPYEMQFRLRRWDGVYRWMHSLSSLGRDDQGRASQWYGLLIDIDARKSMEEALHNTELRLSRATQIATLGELSASIAHEINQPLAAVVASGQACLRFLSLQPPNLVRAAEAVESIVRDGKGAGDVVRRIRALFQRTVVEKVILNLNDVICEVLRLLRSEIARKHVSVETELGIDLPLVPGDRIQLQQLLRNLLLNAIESMDSVDDRHKKILVRYKQESSDTVLVEVRDHGVGLANPDKLFDPFVTTKENGMGIGLTICKSIVEAHNGRLWVANGKGPGTTFCFSLPLRLSPES